jgi:hypothetical protein
MRRIPLAEVDICLSSVSLTTEQNLFRFLFLLDAFYRPLQGCIAL